MNYYRLLYMNFMMMLHLSLSLSLITLLPQISEQNNYQLLGKLSIICFSMAEMCSTITSPVYLRNKSFRTSFTFQALLCFPCFLTTFYVTNCVNEIDSDIFCQPSFLQPISFIGTCFLGFGLGGQFVIQNYYVSKCAGQNDQELYFGTTYIMMGLSSLGNGLISEIGLSIFGRNNYFLFAGILSLGLSLAFLLIQEPTNRTQINIVNPSVSEEFENKSKISDAFLEIYKSIKDKNLLIQYPLFIATGVVMGFEFGFLYRYTSESLNGQGYDEETINKKTARIFIFCGVGQTLSAILNGLIKKYFSLGMNKIIYSQIIALICLIGMINSFALSYNINCVLGFFVGLCDISGQFNAAVTISEQFADAISVYGIYFCIQNTLIAIMMAQAILFESFHLSIILIFILFVQILVSLSTQKEIHYQPDMHTNYLRVIYMNFVLMLHLSLCLSLTSLLPEIAKQNQYQYLGNLSVVSIYTAELLVDIVGPAYLKFFSFKLGFTFQALLTIPSFLTSFYVTNCENIESANTICQSEYLAPISMLGTFFLGIGLGGYFIIQNYYISQCVEPNAHDLYFSTAYVFMGISFLLSGLFSELGIYYFGRDYYFLYAGIFEIVFSLMFLLIKNPCIYQEENKVVNVSEQEEESDVIIPEKEQEQNLLQNLKDIFHQLRNTQLYTLYPVFIATGVILGYEYGFLYEFILKSLEIQNLPQEIVNQKTGRIFLYGGIAQIIAPIINSLVKKYFNTKQYTVYYANLIGVIVMISFVNNYYLSYNLVAIQEFIIAFCDITGQLICTITISEQFKDAMSVYGIYFFCQNLSIAIVVFLGMIFGQTNLIYNLVLVTISQIAVTLSSQYSLRKTQ